MSTAAVGVLALLAALFTMAPSARADNSVVEMPALVPSGPDYQQNLKAEVEFWNLSRMAKAALNNEDHDAVPPSGGWDRLSKPWPVQQGLIGRTAGKLLMEYKNLDTGGTELDACSGNVVTSANKSVVVTAGHCIGYHLPVVGPNLFVDKMVFIPGFNGAGLARHSDSTALPGKDVAPYGVWGVTREWTTDTWAHNGDWVAGGDMAALLVANPSDPRPIAEVTGGQKIAFNQPRARHAAMFGYPTSNERNYYAHSRNAVSAALQRDFDGRTLMFAEGDSWADPVYANDVITGAMAPGSSGGPWLQNFDPATGEGVQTGAFSRYDDPAQIIGIQGWLIGPNLQATQFGDEEQAVYFAAQSVNRA
ncbi:trypsin-like serine peptidase [Streptomyces sp. NPDC052396]|uniref:trypsin-like serine peptidase n=1 Tax=Streptomyces sp. NPDC052396 TaxID=3365689 RepID=UPI0037D6AD78